jgi:hypothetical protein
MFLIIEKQFSAAGEIGGGMDGNPKQPIIFPITSRESIAHEFASGRRMNRILKADSSLVFLSGSRIASGVEITRNYPTRQVRPRISQGFLTQ